MPVTLESRLRQLQVFNLDHGSYCRPGACACSEITIAVIDENPRTGDRAPRHIAKKAPASLTLLARERRAGLPTKILDVPEVRAAIAKGHVRVVAQTAESAPNPDPIPTAQPAGKEP
jgi:hypothetical protein